MDLWVGSDRLHPIFAVGIFALQGQRSLFLLLFMVIDFCGFCQARKAIAFVRSALLAVGF
ncbi:MAG: hypothetical protein SXA11_24005 [Cyanobacteriota bacterium]|nr:hypothetical protein [Cyanobacteriota bacterium]